MSLLSSLLFTGYGALWRAAEPLLRRHKRLAEGFEQRLLPDGWLPADAQSPAAGPHAAPGHSQSETPQKAANGLRLWLQAASGGEAGLVRALVPALAERLATLPDWAGLPVDILLTSCTRQGLDVLDRLEPPQGFRLHCRYFPLDRPDLMDKALRLFAPQAVILLETELWPGLLRAAKKRTLPVLVVNGRMTEKSRKAYGLAKPLWRALAPASVLAISGSDAERFATLFGPSCAVSTMPNIKFDLAVPSPRPRGSAQRLRAECGLDDKSLLLVFASVREEEEDQLLPVLQALHGLNLDGFTVIAAVAPRHMHRVKAWQGKLAAARLPLAFRSARAEKPLTAALPPVFLWDTFGELKALYGAADAVFVGGSLAPLGGQNFLEPLAQGLEPVVGPSVNNFSWTGDDIFTRGLVRRVADAEELRTVLRQSLQERAALLAKAPSANETRRERAAKTRQAFNAWLTSHLGGSALAAEAIVDALFQDRPAGDKQP